MCDLKRATQLFVSNIPKYHEISLNVFLISLNVFFLVSLSKVPLPCRQGNHVGSTGLLAAGTLVSQTRHGKQNKAAISEGVVNMSSKHVGTSVVAGWNWKVNCHAMPFNTTKISKCSSADMCTVQRFFKQGQHVFLWQHTCRQSQSCDSCDR